MAARRRCALAVRIEPRLGAGSAEASLFDAASLRRVRGFLQVGYTRLVTLAGGILSFVYLISFVRRRLALPAGM